MVMLSSYLISRMKRNKAVLIFVLLILLSGCSNIDKNRTPESVLPIDLFVIFNKGLDSEAFDYANQNAWHTVSEYMFRSLQTRLQRINFKNIVYIDKQDEYIPTDNSYLLLINFNNYYIAGRRKTINVDYKLIHNTNMLYVRSLGHGYRNWQTNAQWINKNIVKQAMKTIYKNSRPFIISH